MPECGSEGRDRHLCSVQVGEQGNDSIDLNPGQYGARSWGSNDESKGMDGFPNLGGVLADLPPFPVLATPQLPSMPPPQHRLKAHSSRGMRIPLPPRSPCCLLDLPPSPLFVLCLLEGCLQPLRPLQIPREASVSPQHVPTSPILMIPLGPCIISLRLLLIISSRLGAFRTTGVYSLTV